MMDYFEIIEKGTSLLLLLGIVIIGNQYLKLQDLYISQSKKSIEFIVSTIKVLDTIKETQDTINSSTKEGYNSIKTAIDVQSNLFVSLFDKLEQSKNKDIDLSNTTNSKITELEFKINHLSTLIKDFNIK